MGKAALTDLEEIKKGIEKAEYVKRGSYSFFMLFNFGNFGELSELTYVYHVQRSWRCMLHVELILVPWC